MRPCGPVVDRAAALRLHEDLIAAAFNDAARKAEEASEAKMGKLTGGMPGLPGGLKLPF